MKHNISSIISVLFIFTILLTTITTYVPTAIASSSETQTSVLMKKISTDFTKKFCNSIGFGLSKESAMNFARSENNKIFEKRKGIQNIDKELLADEIALSVVDSCGYQFNAFGEKDIQEFSNSYLSIYR